MVSKKFSLIAAACENMGIGFNGDLPWRLRKEFRYFNQMTTRVNDPSRQNALIMGRSTYFSIPEANRPLAGRLTVVLSRTSKPDDYPEDVLLCTSLADAMRLLQERYANEVESVWIAGGSAVYKDAMESEHCDRIYLTAIKATFECDTFFPAIGDDFRRIANDNGVPSEEQEENGIRYEFQIYEKVTQ